MAQAEDITSKAPGKEPSPAGKDPAAPHPAPNAWLSFWQILVRFEMDKAAPVLALRHTIGVTLPLAVGVMFGSPASALPVSTGALNVGFTDSYEPYPRRAGRMLAASFLVGVAVFTGALSGGHHSIAVGIAAVWAFAAGLMVALSVPAADLGVISLVTLLVYSASPLPLHHAIYAGLLAFAGGLLQMLLALFFWPLRRFGPERRVLSDLFLEIARTAATPAPGSINASHAPPASMQINHAQSMLSTRRLGASVEAERYRLLLSQAERMRVALITLRRLRSRLRRQYPEGGEHVILDRFFETYSRLLEAIGKSLLSSQPPEGVAEGLKQVQDFALALKAPGAPSAGDARLQMDALTGQLRTAFDLATSATPAGMAAFDRRESRQPWELRFAGAMATLRANLTLNSAAFRHAVRLAVCIAMGDSLGRGLGLQRSYWLPMTVAIVLKPDFSATFSRGVLRLIGTYAGLMLATALFHWLTPAESLQVVMIAVLMFAMRCFGPANYGIFVTAVTALVVVLFALAGYQPKEVIAARAVNTIAGGSIALLAYALWPTWERTHVAEAIAQMLDAYREYFRAVRESYLQPDESHTPELDRTRLAGRLARSNVEASIDRLLAEPGTSAVTVTALSAILASTHRLVHALMALEAGLAASHPTPARDAFRPFANDVELTLYYQAAALRGSPLELKTLPALREDHNALVQSGDALTERFALVNVETDRIVNSLNTISEELVRWISSWKSRP